MPIAFRRSSHVRSVLRGIVSGEVDSFFDEPLTARPHGLDVEGLLLLVGEVLIESLENDLGVLGTV